MLDDLAEGLDELLDHCKQEPATALLETLTVVAILGLSYFGFLLAYALDPK